MDIVKLPLGNGEADLCAWIRAKSEAMPDRLIRPAILLIPGGGYRFLSERENEPVALMFLSAGYNVFVLRYPVGEMAAHPAPLLAAAAAIFAIRDHAAEWNVDPERVAVVGFSAGGHLAASLGTMWRDAAILQREPGSSPERYRPDALVLCYPVITGGSHRHEGSFLNLSGGDAAIYDRLSLEKRVSAETPPTFIWATSEDELVPVPNSLLFASALAAAGVPFELHIFERGAHGLSLANAETGRIDARAERWIELAIGWLELRFS